MSYFRFALLLCLACAITACHEQSSQGNASAVTVPESFEIDFDGVFDLRVPCELTPESLEAKVQALAVVPREKLFKVVQDSGDIRYLFSANYAPVHNPSFSIFKSAMHPNFVSVVWQGRSMERFYCVYAAEKDQEVPPELLAAMDSSLGAPHTFNTAVKRFEWDLANFSVSAEYSTHVGKGDPAFLVNVRNKQVQPAIRKLGVAPGQSATGPAIVVNLDELIDWSAPAGVSMRQFDDKIAAMESEAGQKLFRRTSNIEDARFFDPERKGREVKFSFFGGQYFISGGYISWKKEGPMSLIDLVQMTTPDGKEVDPTTTLAKLDQKFGSAHVREQPHAFVWNLPAYEAVMIKYANTTGHGLRFHQPRSIRFPAQKNLGVAPRTPTPAGSPASSPAAPATPPSPAPASGYFKLKLAQINGLLISPLSSGEEAGQSTKMTLTALPRTEPGPSKLDFNQKVGQDMLKSIAEVAKHAQLRHSAWPAGHLLQVGFEDKYIEKDGPSAAVACALLVESAVTGAIWDPAFAVTGDMNADGSVQPIGGVRAKVRGATKGGCRVVAVPHKNESLVRDILVLDGPAPLAMIAVFGIETFEDALLLAKTDRPPALRDALANFEAMRPALQRDPRQAAVLLRTPHAIQRLQALLQAAPNCYSAKYLLLHAQGRAPKVLSIGGSIDAAHTSAQGIIYSIENDVESNVKTLKPDEVGTSLNKLRNLRPILDPRVWPYVDGLLDYGDVVRGAILNPVRSGARYVDLVTKARRAASAAQTAFKSLMGSAAVREELGL
ncbi:MAG: S16 family serine protease [Prosthecobacter sp.]